MKKCSTHDPQDFHKISTVETGRKTNRDAVIVNFSTKYRPPIYYISRRSLTFINFCLDNGVHFTGVLFVNCTVCIRKLPCRYSSTRASEP